MNLVDNETGAIITECTEEQRVFFYDEEMFLKNAYDYMRFWTRKKTLTKKEFLNSLESIWIQEHVDEVDNEWKHENVTLK